MVTRIELRLVKDIWNGWGYGAKPEDTVFVQATSADKALSRVMESDFNPNVIASRAMRAVGKCSCRIAVIPPVSKDTGWQFVPADQVFDEVVPLGVYDMNGREALIDDLLAWGRGR